MTQSDKNDRDYLVIANGLRDRRLSYGSKFIQELVANEVGIARSRYANFEAGIWIPTCATILKLQAFYECEPNDLYSLKVLKFIEDIEENGA